MLTSSASLDNLGRQRDPGLWDSRFQKVHSNIQSQNLATLVLLFNLGIINSKCFGQAFQVNPLSAGVFGTGHKEANNCFSDSELIVKDKFANGINLFALEQVLVAKNVNNVNCCNTNGHIRILAGHLDQAGAKSVNEMSQLGRIPAKDSGKVLQDFQPVAKSFYTFGSNLGVDIPVAVNKDGVEKGLDRLAANLTVIAVFRISLRFIGVFALPISRLSSRVSNSIIEIIGDHDQCRLHCQGYGGCGMTEWTERRRRHASKPCVKVVDKKFVSVHESTLMHVDDEVFEEANEHVSEGSRLFGSGDERVVGDLLLRRCQPEIPAQKVQLKVTSW
ncbi:hypothetical protein HG530_007351 [Fusarium avenaceum]|nr:hypothetical protein HG530_007351 [Fusarium avenaceum]